MTDNPTFSARATPLGRAAVAIEARIRRSIDVELRPGMTGQLFGATMPELARDAVSAALDVEEMARVELEHETTFLIRQNMTWTCKCGHEGALVGPDLGNAPGGEWISAHRRHKAAALRAAILGGAA